MEWLTFGLSALCAIGSFVGFMLAQREKKEAKKSEAAAKEYAENANKANIEIQRYTQHLNAEVDKQQAFEGEKKKVKEYLIRSYNDKPESASGIEYVNKDVFDGKGDKDLILRILRDLEADGVIESMNFYGTEEFAIFKLKRTY